MHGMDLADRAAKAWEGPKSLNGRASSDLTPFGTTRLYFGRTFPLRLPFVRVCRQRLRTTLSSSGHVRVTSGVAALLRRSFSVSWTQ
eukprot:7181327-Prymnesium_polylepis.1